MSTKRVIKIVSFLLIFGIGFISLQSCGDKKKKQDATEKVIKTEKSGDSKCGEGKCGGDAKEVESDSEGKCGEGKCGGDKKEAKESKEEETKKADEGKDSKCGTGKCGG